MARDDGSPLDADGHGAAGPRLLWQQAGSGIAAGPHLNASVAEEAECLTFRQFARSELIRTSSHRSRADHACSSASARRSTAMTSIPLKLPAFGALPLGTIARLKPCVAASFRRSSPLGTG